MASKTSEAMCCDNTVVKECCVNNVSGYPKEKLKKLDSSDVEVASLEIHSPSKQKLCEINSDSGIDMKKNFKFKKVNRKKSNKNKLNDSMMVVSSPHVKNKRSRDFKSDVELTDTFLNESGGCSGPETKSKSLIIENLCHGDRKGSTDNVIKSNHKKLLKSRRCDQSTEGCLTGEKITSFYETLTKTSDPVEESCTRQETLHEVERQIYLNKSEDVDKFNSDSCSHLFGKVKKKRKHKNKFHNSIFFSQYTEGSESASSDFPHKKRNKNKKNKGRLDEIKPLQEGNNCDSIHCRDLPFINNLKKKKHKNELQDSDPGNAKCFTDHHAHEIKKKKEDRSELDKIKDRLITQALEKFRPICVENTDKLPHVNKKVNEILGLNELDSNQETFVNILRDQKKRLHHVPREPKHDNEDLKNLRATLMSSALKRIGYKQSESNDIHVDCNKSADNSGQGLIKETNRSSCNKTYERKHKKEEGRGKVKEKDMYKFAHDLNKKSSNTLYTEDNIRKALITAALKRIKRNEQKHRNKVSLADCSEQEVTPKHKNKRKAKIDKSVGKKNKISEMERMRSFLISAALAKMNDNNEINETTNVNNKNRKVES